MPLKPQAPVLPRLLVLGLRRTDSGTRLHAPLPTLGKFFNIPWSRASSLGGPYLWGFLWISPWTGCSPKTLILSKTNAPRIDRVCLRAEAISGVRFDDPMESRTSSRYSSYFSRGTGGTRSSGSSKIVNGSDSLFEGMLAVVSRGMEARRRIAVYCN